MDRTLVERAIQGLVRACYVEADRSRRWNANMRVLPIDLPGTSNATSTVADHLEIRSAGSLSLPGWPNSENDRCRAPVVRRDSQDVTAGAEDGFDGA
jgi:hypothetical protein